uniref:Keratin n=1 Tax=Anolis carolinensis TaxID=28377 RepID=A0A803TML9_ANOCA
MFCAQSDCLIRLIVGPALMRCGTSTSSCCLGTVPRVVPSCINQLPPLEVVIQPSPVVVTLPGPLLSASREPVAVGGTTPCAIAGRCSGIRGIGCSPCY